MVSKPIYGPTLENDASANKTQIYITEYINRKSAFTLK